MRENKKVKLIIRRLPYNLHSAHILDKYLQTDRQLQDINYVITAIIKGKYKNTKTRNTTRYTTAVIELHTHREARKLTSSINNKHFTHTTTTTDTTQETHTQQQLTVTSTISTQYAINQRGFAQEKQNKKNQSSGTLQQDEDFIRYFKLKEQHHQQTQEQQQQEEEKETNSLQQQDSLESSKEPATGYVPITSLGRFLTLKLQQEDQRKTGPRNRSKKKAKGPKRDKSIKKLKSNKPVGNQKELRKEDQTQPDKTLSKKGPQKRSSRGRQLQEASKSNSNNVPAKSDRKIVLLKKNKGQGGPSKGKSGGYRLVTKEDTSKEASNATVQSTPSPVSSTSHPSKKSAPPSPASSGRTDHERKQGNRKSRGKGRGGSRGTRGRRDKAPRKPKE